MPYLHWETSRKQEQFASEIDSIIGAEAKKKAAEENRRKEARIFKRQRKTNQPSNEQEATHAPVPTDGKITGLFEMLLDWQLKKPTSFPHKKAISNMVDFPDVVYEIAELPVLKKSKTKLGLYLLAAAHLCEGMATYRDRKFLWEYLPKDPPLHPRRTLDQSFYWTLKSTKKRDRDQVIYRSTTARQSHFHRYNQYDKNLRWPDHVGLEKGQDCEPCKVNIKKVSRVVMVDQLWMWVLDQKTIITCFPKRYGANKQDYSGVHKSIRTRLETLDPNTMRTVFELAIIILDECTNTFFRRAKSQDRQPQVIDEFSKAIGNIVSTVHFQPCRK